MKEFGTKMEMKLWIEDVRKVVEVDSREKREGRERIEGSGS